MTDSSIADRFWDAYVTSQAPGRRLHKRYHEAFRFGNTPEMADTLAALALAGTKTAASSLLWEYQAEGKALYAVGDLHVVTTWDGAPVCVIETVELAITPFNKVDARFAYDYGEGERTLAWWRQNMWEYYAAECATLGRTPHDEMPLLCERFRAVFPPGPHAST